MALQSTFTPRELVGELDRHIVGQNDAKRAVAIALRNRWRRQQISEGMREDISPKNIILIGPTGVGKTEVARRLAKLVKAPFLKVEASKFTEVGYVGRDVESIVRDLTDIGIRMVQEEEEEKAIPRAEKVAEDRLLDLLVPNPVRPAYEESGSGGPMEETREKFRKMLREGSLDERTVTVEIEERSGTAMFDIFASNSGMEADGLKDVLGSLVPGKSKKKKMTVAEARTVLIRREATRLVDSEKVVESAIKRIQDNGIVFLDEIDKVAGNGNGHSGPDISRQGVQRDILPIVEGSMVKTKHGFVRTNHILFIAAGAFHVSSPSDLIPELQGRFPIRVELQSLGVDDFVRILTEPEHSLTQQYSALLETEGVTLEWTEEGIRACAEVAAEANRSMENIGARRLHTVLEVLLEEISFAAPETKGATIEVSRNMVEERLSSVVGDRDLSQYIL